MGMLAQVYRAALSGSFEEVSHIPTWLEQSTPTENNVLHLHLGRPLHKKDENGMTKGMVNVQFIKKILEYDVKLLYKANNKGDTPLHLGARFGHDLAVKELLVQARDQLNEEETTRLLRMINKKKDTALHDAARIGHTEVVELLVKWDPQWRHEPNEEGETPLYLAAERGSTNSMLKIIETCETDALDYKWKGPCGRTVLHAAVLWGDSEMVKKILEKDSSLIRVQDDEGMTPLHCASVEIDKFQTLKELLDYEDQNINILNQSLAVYIQVNNGRTSLHIAVLRCNWIAVKAIIASFPDCIEITDKNGQNVMHYIAKQACVLKLRNFLRLENFDSLLNEKDVDGNTPLHLFAAFILTDFNPDHKKTCLYWLPTFIHESPLIDKKAFNKSNLTFADIIAYHARRAHRPLLSIMSEKLVPRGRRIYKLNDDVNVEKAMSEVDSLEKVKMENLGKIWRKSNGSSSSNINSIIHISTNTTRWFQSKPR